MADAPDTERQAIEPNAREVLSVSQLNDRIASIVQDMPALNGVRCIGEVTDLHKNSTALYFALTDGDADLPCMIWTPTRSRRGSTTLATAIPKSSSRWTTSNRVSVSSVRDSRRRQSYCIGDAATESNSEYSQSRPAPSSLRRLYCAIFERFEVR
jgi:hypothetical protein